MPPLDVLFVLKVLVHALWKLSMRPLHIFSPHLTSLLLALVGSLRRSLLTMLCCFFSIMDWIRVTRISVWKIGVILPQLVSTESLSMLLTELLLLLVLFNEL